MYVYVCSGGGAARCMLKGHVLPCHNHRCMFWWVLQVAAGFVLHKGSVASGTLRVGDNVTTRCGPAHPVPRLLHVVPF
jgi:hypothetical protein